MREIKDMDEFKKFVEDLGGDKLVVVDFHAQWCGPCKGIAPKLQAMSVEFGNVEFCKVDVDEAEDVARKYEISAMPTFLFFKNGQKVGEVIGANEAKVREAIKSHS